MILDTSALIAILRLEPEASEFAAIIERAPHRRMSAVTYVEAGAVIDSSKDPIASRRLDELITRTVPGVRKAVKWNSPLYGAGGPGQGESWFLGIHVFRHYVKIAFFRGAALRPIPPVESRNKDTRYLDIHEDDAFDEAQIRAWVKQASRLPGQPM